MSKLLRHFVAIVGFVFFTTATTAALAAEKQKVVYHISEAPKAEFALSNVKNHIKGMGGPENVSIVVVVHGPAGKAFHDVAATDNVRETVAELQKQGVEFDMCANTMRAQGVELNDLLPHFVVAEHGGVVRIAQLQQKGYVYIRP